MPTTELEQKIAQRKEEIATLLHNGNPVTIKDLAWLFFFQTEDIENLCGMSKGINKRMDELAAAIDKLANKPPDPLWQIARESFVKSAAVLVWGLLLWALVTFANSGLKLP